MCARKPSSSFYTRLKSFLLNFLRCGFEPTWKIARCRCFFIYVAILLCFLNSGAVHRQALVCFRLNSMLVSLLRATSLSKILERKEGDYQTESKKKMLCESSHTYRFFPSPYTLPVRPKKFFPFPYHWESFFCWAWAWCWLWIEMPRCGRGWKKCECEKYKQNEVRMKESVSSYEIRPFRDEVRVQREFKLYHTPDLRKGLTLERCERTSVKSH